VPCRRGYRGNLYLSEKEDGSLFTLDDEESLVRFAQQAAIGIDNAVLHRESRELAAARERLRLAGQMYDGMAQVLAYVNTKSQVVREHIRQGRSEAAIQHLEQLADAARRVYAEQRARLLDLKALQEEASSTVDAIAHHVRAWEEEVNLNVELRLPPAIEAAPDVELQLLRIVQEGLDNVRRHSRAHHVRLTVSQEGPALHLELSDDGVGFDPQVPAPGNGGGPRFGLAAMHERAQAVGGTLEVAASPGSGTVLRLDLPTHPGQEVRRAIAHR
jgi:signal transduction histidine kinase